MSTEPNIYDLDDHDGKVGEYSDCCLCEDCLSERGRRLSVLMFGWMVR